MTLTEYLKSIADAIRDRQRSTEPINAQNFASEIANIEPPFDDVEITKNGEHDIKNYKKAIVFVPTSDTAINLIQREVTGYEVPYGITKITGHVFQEWKTLESLVLPETVTEIDDKAFYFCTKLVVNVPSRITKIGSQAYAYTAIKNLVLPETLTSLGNGAFMGCSELTSISLPNSLNTVPERCFDSCYKLKEVVIPEGYTTISKGAFRGCFDLSKITIPDTVTTFGDSCFASCQNLKEITLPDTVTTLSSNMFSSSGLESFTFPPGVTKIPYGCFHNTKFEVFRIPSQITWLGQDCLISSVSNYSVIMESETPCSNESGAFDHSKLGKIFVPKGTSEAYKTAWANYADYIVEENDINFLIDASIVNNEHYAYSLDNGETWQQFAFTSIVLENINLLRFKSTATDKTLRIGRTSGGAEIGTVTTGELIYPTTADETIYISTVDV